MSALVGVGGFFVFVVGIFTFISNFRRPEKRKRSKYLLLAGLILFVVGLSIPSDDDTAEAELESKPGASEIASSSSVETVEVAEGANEEPEEQTVGIGQEIIVGDIAYMVNSIETSDYVGNEYFGESPQGVFLLINVTVTNNGNEPLDVSNSFFNIVDGEKEFESNSIASIHANEESDSFFANSINPELSLTSDVVFDVPQSIVDSQTKQLEVRTGYWGTERGFINLK